MGNKMGCFHPKAAAASKPASSRRSRRSPPLEQVEGAGKPAKSSPEKTNNLSVDHALIRQQALEAALLFRRHQESAALPFDRSTSVSGDRFSASRKKQQPQQKFPRSSSTRPLSMKDSLLQPQQLVDQGKAIADLETKHFVLVHGGGFGAWCWYKTIALLEQSGYKVDAVDLTGSGIHSFDTNSVSSLAQYAKPLTSFLQNLGDGEKVILVGHDFGGACISYAMELFPSKVAKAIFVAAAMLGEGQSTLNVFIDQTGANGLMQQAKVLLYGNGKDQPPTAIGLDRALLRDLLFNKSPDKDIALASVSMRPIPFAPVLEKLSLSDTNYGSIRRFYIKTQDDGAIPISVQESMISLNPPEQVFQLKGSDHSPFFSKPQALHRLLVEISKILPSRVEGEAAQ